MVRVTNPKTGEVSHFYYVHDALAAPPFGIYRIIWKKKKEIGRQLTKPNYDDCLNYRSKERRRDAEDVIQQEARRLAEFVRNHIPVDF